MPITPFGIAFNNRLSDMMEQDRWNRLHMDPLSYARTITRPELPMPTSRPSIFDYQAVPPLGTHEVLSRRDRDLVVDNLVGGPQRVFRQDPGYSGYRELSFEEKYRDDTTRLNQRLFDRTSRNRW